MRILVVCLVLVFASQAFSEIQEELQKRFNAVIEAGKKHYAVSARCETRRDVESCEAETASIAAFSQAIRKSGFGFVLVPIRITPARTEFRFYDADAVVRMHAWMEKRRLDDPEWKSWPVSPCPEYISFRTLFVATDPSGNMIGKGRTCGVMSDEALGKIVHGIAVQNKIVPRPVPAQVGSGVLIFYALCYGFFE